MIRNITAFRNQRDAVRGFSLTELLVAVAVASLVLLMGFTITQQTLDQWKTAGATLGRSAEARIAFDSMIRDLQSVVFRQRDVEWFSLTYDKGIGAESGYSVREAVRLRFFADEPVTYRLAYEDPIDEVAGTRKAFGLYRTEDAQVSAEQHLMFRSAAATRSYWNAAESKTTDPVHLAAANVVAFDVAIWYRVRENLLRVPPGATLRVVGSKVETSPSISELTHASQLEIIDVSMVSLSDEAALQLEEGIGDGEDVIASNAYRHSARVRLNTASAGMP